MEQDKVVEGVGDGGGRARGEMITWPVCLAGAALIIVGLKAAYSLLQSSLPKDIQGVAAIGTTFWGWLLQVPTRLASVSSLDHGGLTPATLADRIVLIGAVGMLVLWQVVTWRGFLDVSENTRDRRPGTIGTILLIASMTLLTALAAVAFTGAVVDNASFVFSVVCVYFLFGAVLMSLLGVRASWLGGRVFPFMIVAVAALVGFGFLLWTATNAAKWLPVNAWRITIAAALIYLSIAYAGGRAIVAPSLARAGIIKGFGFVLLGFLLTTVVLAGLIAA